MPPINDSKDLLYIVISISVLIFTIFSCWALYYLARILQQMFKVIRETRARLDKFDELAKMIGEKIGHSVSYLPLIGAGLKKLVEIMRVRTEKKKTNKEAWTFSVYLIYPQSLLEHLTSPFLAFSTNKLPQSGHFSPVGFPQKAVLQVGYWLQA